MITASSLLQQTSGKLHSSPVSFSMSLSPGVASSASPGSSVADSAGRSATPSPAPPRSPQHGTPVSLTNRRPGSISPVRCNSTNLPSSLTGPMSGSIPVSSSMSFAALHAAAAAAAANQGALFHGKAGLLGGMPGVPGSLAGLAGIHVPEAYHHGLYLSHPAAVAAAAANLHNAERSLYAQGLHGHPGLHGNHPDRSSYSSSHSPPPIPTTDPTANECKLVDYRGQKVAAFIIHGETMLCLPQAFELFLKHLVGGLHTVYTKLKRLDIVPLVCNVEQVRILRGLGAIQPGVNRCKLLSCKDFDILYKDCTTARPGRPPKRSPLMGITSPQHEVLMKMKKPRLENGDYLPYENGHVTDSRAEKSPLLGNGYNAAPPSHLNPMQFMALNHAAAAAAAQHALLGSPAAGMPGSLPPGLTLAPPGSHPLAPGQGHNANPSAFPGHNSSMLHRNENDPNKGYPTANQHAEHMNPRPGFWENCRAAYEDVVKHLERLKDDRSESEKTSSTVDAVKNRELLATHNGANASPILNLSKTSQHPHNSLDDPKEGHSADEEALGSGSEGPRTPRQAHRDDDNSDMDSDVDDDDDNKEMSDAANGSEKSCSDPQEASSAQAVATAAALNYSAFLNASVADQSVMLGSTEALLRNIQGLLKVAAENTRQQERQANYEKAELKMEILRERELRESFEKQLSEEQRIRVVYQKRIKRERRSRRKLLEQLDSESKMRNKYEEALKNSSAETYAKINEAIHQELEAERKARNLQQQQQQQQQNNNDNNSTQENRGAVYYKNSVLFSNNA